MSENKKSAVGSVIGTVVLAVACAAGGWIARELVPKGAMKMPEIPRGAVTVSVHPVEERQYNLPEKFVAHAEAMQEVDLLPQVDGYVKEIRFKEGDIVKAGAILYVLDDERYQAVANQRKADLAASAASPSSSATTQRRRTSAPRRPSCRRRPISSSPSTTARRRR